MQQWESKTSENSISRIYKKLSLTCKPQIGDDYEFK
jgi:hypothetical protein